MQRCYSSIPVISKTQLEVLIKVKRITFSLEHQKNPSAKYTLIDVRNPDEVQRTGLIPTAKCLPREF